jgi:hypothetical protein
MYSQKEAEFEVRKQFIDLYNNTMRKVLDALAISIGVNPCMDINGQFIPQWLSIKTTPSFKPILDLYFTDPMAELVIDRLLECSKELSLMKSEFKNGKKEWTES